MGFYFCYINIEDRKEEKIYFDNVKYIYIEEMKDVLKKSQQKHYYDETHIYERIKQILQELNYNYSYLGTKLLIDCIFEGYKTNKLYDLNLDKEIYPIVAQKYHKTKINIKCSINYSTNAMYLDTNKDIISNFFGYKLLDKPKPKDIVIEVLRKLYE